MKKMSTFVLSSLLLVIFSMTSFGSVNEKVDFRNIPHIQLPADVKDVLHQFSSMSKDRRAQTRVLKQLIMMNDTPLMAVVYQVYVGGTWQNVTRALFSVGVDWEELERLINEFENLDRIVTTPTLGLGFLLDLFQFVFPSDFYMLFQEWDGGAWNDVAQILTFPDAQGRVGTINFQNQQGGIWVDTFVFLFSYNTNDAITAIEMKAWIEGVFKSALKLDVAYDTNGFMTQNIMSAWIAAVWQPLLQILYTRDERGNSIEELLQIAGVMGQWFDAERWEYEYDDRDNMTSALYQTQSMGKPSAESSSMAWVNVSWDHFTYEVNNLVEHVQQNFEDNTWVNAWKELFSYNTEDQEIAWLMQVWEDGDWVNSLQDSTYYNAEENVERIISQTWQNNVWANLMQTLFTYASPMPTEMLVQIWQNNQWMNSERFLFDYNPADTPVAEDFLEGDALPTTFSMANYPNPFNPATTIRFVLVNSTDVSLSVYDINGRLVKSLIDGKRHAAGAHAVHWDGTNQSGGQAASGVYLYRIDAGDVHHIQRCILMK